MKKVTFFIVLGLMMLFASMSSATSKDVLDSHVETRDEYNGDYTELIIEVSGKHHFEKRLGTSESRYYLAGIGVFDEQFMFYGSINLVTDEARTLNAFVLTVDVDGNVVEEWIYEDFDTSTRVVEHFEIEEMVILQIEERVEIDDRISEFSKTHFVKMQENMSIDASIRLPEKLNHREVIDGVLYLARYQNRDYAYAINASFKLYDQQYVYGIINQQTYEGKASGFVLNPALIGTEVVFGYFEIEYPGHYVIDRNGETLNFTVEPTVSGVQDGGVYNQRVRIDLSAGYALLNGRVFSLDDEIVEPGEYTLTIEGLNGYQKTLAFTMMASLEGVYDGNTYDNARTLTFNGEGYLNNRLISSGTVVDEAGEYHLRIEGKNGYSEQHSFIIDFNEADDTSSNFMLFMEVGLVVSALVIVGGWFIYQKFVKK